jgi:hypothetical protein
MRNGIRRLSIMVAVVGAALSLTGAPAHAAVRGDACGAGACGSATWNWSGDSRAVNINMNVRDTACDGHDVYISFLVYPTIWETQQRRNSSGCNTSSTWRNLTLNQDGGISGLKVVVCVDDAGPNTCYKSRLIQNPNV